MAIAETLRAYLDQKGIAYDLVAHPRTYSSHDSAVAAHVPDDHLAKGVIVQDDGGAVEIVVPASQWVKLNAVRLELGRPVDFADEKELDRFFPDCVSGAIPAAGQAYGIETLLDTALTTLANVYLEAGDHEHLVHVTGDGFRELMQGLRHGHFASGD